MPYGGTAVHLSRDPLLDKKRANSFQKRQRVQIMQSAEGARGPRGGEAALHLSCDAVKVVPVVILVMTITAWKAEEDATDL